MNTTSPPATPQDAALPPTRRSTDGTPRQRRPTRRTVGIVLAVIALALLVLYLLWDWNWFKGPITRAVEAKTGREFRIDGNLDVDLGRVTTIKADGLYLGNATWSKSPEMAWIDRAEVDMRLFPAIFKRTFIIPDIRLTKPRVRLETGPDGKGNWVFKQDDEPAGELPTFRRVFIDTGRLQFINAKDRTDIDLSVGSVVANATGASPPIDVKGSGHWQGNDFNLSGRAESPLDLQDTTKPYRIDLRANAGATKAHANGTLLDPFALRDFDLQFALSGKNLDDLYPLIGVALPTTPPYSLDGRLRRDGNTWKYDDFTGRVGDSDLAGMAHVTVGRARPLLEAKLVSKRLDFDDLAGFIGAAPTTGAGEATNPEIQALAAKEAASPRVLPTTPYNLEKLRAMDADVQLKAQRINAPSLPIDDMDAHLKLDAGLLQLTPLNFGVAGGDIKSNIRMDARKATIQTKADVDVRGLNLGKLFPDAKLTQDAIGKLGGHFVLAGSGNSIAAMLGSSDGTVAAGIGKGEISNLLLELAGLDIQETLKFLLGKDHKVGLRCAFADFNVKDGLMTSNALAFDTTDTIIVGEGTINLKDESMALTLRPRPKDRSILVLRSPLKVSGTFKDPSFRPDLAKLGLRGAVALALGTIAPPAALLATLELGPGKDSDCGGKYAK